MYQCIIVQIEIDDTALIIDGTCGTIGYCLSHVIHVDILPEHLFGISVALGDGRTRKAKEDGIGQSLTKQQGIAFLHALRLVIPMFIAILRTVCLVGDDDDITPVAEQSCFFLKLLDGGEDDAAAHTAFEQLGKFLAALGLLWSLTQEVLAAAELAEELVVEVLAVGDHDERTFGEVLDEEVGKEHHAQRLA